MVRGSCLCGAVTFEASGSFDLMSHCHCSYCRKTHGAAFGTYVGTQADGFRFVSGEDKISHYESSPGFFRPFCMICGSKVPGEPTNGMVFMPAGILDDDPQVRPQAHIFVASKSPWYEITDALPRFDQYPPGFGESLPEPERERVPEGAVRGSCLCGGVAYELSGPLELIVDCHCSRCRKARSAAFGSNLLVKPEQLRWLRGEDQLVEYSPPEAEFFTTCFCRVCGSSLPRRAEGRFVPIPCGTLDADPGARERFHIYVASKAPWHEITDDLPQNDEGIQAPE